MYITVIGLNHHKAPLHIRERIAFNAEQLPEALANLSDKVGAVAVLSTCNRTEIYTSRGDAQGTYAVVRKFLASFHRIPEDTFSPYLYTYFSDEAVNHLCRVAAGLDSQILGEPQILGQIKAAQVAAQTANTIDKRLDYLFRQAIRAGKRARTETAIARNGVSHSFVAVTLARTIFGNLRGRQIAVVGTGKIGTLTARTLREFGAENITYVNRTFERAAELAMMERAHAAPLSSLPDVLANVDIVISSSSATQPIITAELIEKVMRSRRHRPILLVDLAVPRNIEPEAAKSDGIYLYNIDDLEALIMANQRERAGEISAVEKIVAEEAQKYNDWTRTLEVVPTIVALRQHAENIRQSELARMANTLETMSDEQRNAMEAVTIGIINKMLHEPTIRLKEHATDQNGPRYIDLLRDLFNLADIS